MAMAIAAGTAEAGANIQALSPSMGSPGTQVTITGSGFGSDTSNVTVTFSGVTAAVISVTPTKIQTVVPINATTGAIIVYIRANSPVSFTVV